MEMFFYVTAYLFVGFIITFFVRVHGWPNILHTHYLEAECLRDGYTEDTCPHAWVGRKRMGLPEWIVRIVGWPLIATKWFAVANLTLICAIIFGVVELVKLLSKVEF